MYKTLIYFFIACLITACSDDSQELEFNSTLPLPLATDVDYASDIKPIIEEKCVACHGCFDAPCQLKMESTEGVLRGATKLNAYDGTRQEPIVPTRLFTDANSEEEWRNAGFYSILSGQNAQASLLYRMLALGKTHQFKDNSKLPEDLDISIRRENQCPTVDTISDYEKRYPLTGMPFAVSGLTDDEFSTISGWLYQGAKVSEDQVELNKNEISAIEEWEAYLNQTSNQRKLVSRWLYEHLFLAHLYFDGKQDNTHFFELVRSYSPPGEPISIVKTRLPNSEPEDPIYYRLRLVKGITVHKRHITLLFDDKLKNHIEKLFFTDKWDVDILPGYDYEARANPFVTFSAIPAKARYQFLLDHAEYFTRTFIRGPVCRGQIATDVIRDQFWVMYQDPANDLFITDAKYRKKVEPLLGLPGQDDNLTETKENWDKYKDKRNAYLSLRDQHYQDAPLNWTSTKAIWDGGGNNTNAFLTVFRHFDNASVVRGMVGQVPQTLWWMDFPLFERTYYELVVNFDLFGNVAHQLQTRLYFDLIRNGAEHNFLRLLPRDKRKSVLNDWYQGMGAVKTYFTYAPLDIDIRTEETFSSDDTKNELANRLLTQFSQVNAAENDPINRCQNQQCFRMSQTDWKQKADSWLSRLTNSSLQETSGLQFLPELTFIRVKHGDERTVYSLIRNRYHTNVAFLFGESLRYKPEKDSLTVYPGIAGSYPNFIFDIETDELEVFEKSLMEAKSEEAFDALVQNWGVRRTHPKFWQIFHDFTQWQREQNPIDAGVFDANRYENL
nr:fatty acid cis/trans isomerase [uncultured Methylophaga sp.]